MELPFPLAGPLPPWRGIIAFFALVPLLWAILTPSEFPRPLRRAFLLGYLCGILWYTGNCYWIYDTMHIHGGIPPVGSVGLLLLFSLVLGLYFGVFTLALKFIAGKLGIGIALIAAPFLWTALDLAAARITSVPWDQLGYSQVDNALLTHLAPVAGVYGITFVVVATNSWVSSYLLKLSPTGKRWQMRVFEVALIVSVLEIWAGILGRPMKSPRPTPTATAILVQPNLDVDSGGLWPAPIWDQHIAQFTHFATQTCRSYLAGIPETGATTVVPECVQPPAHPDLVAWPESPAPYFEDDPRFRSAMKQVALAAHSPLIIGGVGMEQTPDELHEFNSAMVFGANGSPQGRYDKIHLVPYGEFIPYRNLFFFAKKLTRKVEDLSRGTDRKTFLLTDSHGQSHRYGIFICYESVFADEVREFAKNGAEVFVNISDDGWYGDTSAPWQHLNMARMRAIENRRWILRDTNNGVTAVIDPYGRVRQSIPRHTVGALVAQYGFNSETTFYTRHGDVFSWLCAILSLGFVAWSFNTRLALKVQVKSGPEQIS
jgi:apolipoprotein N-acyltransferase